MRGVVLCLMLSPLAAWTWGCAETSVCPERQAFVNGACRPEDPYAPKTKIINLGCLSTPPIVPVNIACCVQWELTVAPQEPIVAGEAFKVDFQARAIFDESAIGLALALPIPPFSAVEFVELNATVHVREGATGTDVALVPELAFPFTAEIPVSNDCAPGGFCEAAGRLAQCENAEFCVSGPIVVPLKGTGLYEAAPSGNVLFGFDDVGTGVKVVEDGSCDEGTYLFEDLPTFETPAGPNGFRMILGGVELPAECVMGELSRGDFGIDSCRGETSRTPDSRLIRFPIQVSEGN